jgi:Carboxypeptidase regulatory-like domain/TonB dependent receptor-like, beta-barrel
LYVNLDGSDLYAKSRNRKQEGERQMMEYPERARFECLEETWRSVTARSLRNPTAWTLAVCVVVLALLVPAAVRAQVGSADVLGTVTDSTGAVVSAAKVTIRNLGTAAARTTTTDAKGEYIFNTLPNGTYTLTVEAKGFKAYTVADFPLTTDARARYDVSLQTGAVTEKIEVTGQVAALQTDSSTVGSTIADSTVQDLPLNARSFEAAIQIQPGVTAGPGGSMAAGTSPEDRRPSFVIVANGQSDALNNQMIDGFDNNERNLGLGGVRPSIDGIAEVKVDTSSYSAANGRAAGAVINVVTKGGTNQFHGSLYEYFRNDILDTRDFFATAGVVKKAEYRQNFYGGSIGGPIRKDKTFFFASFEQDRLIKGLGAIEANVPTEYERNQMNSLGVLDLTDVNPSLAVIPASQVNPIMKAYFNLFPHCNACTANGINNFVASPSEPQNGTNVDGRIDHHFSSNDLLFGRFAYNPVKTLYPEPFPVDKATGIYPGGNGASGFPGPSNTKSYNLQLDYVHIFNPSLLLDLKAGYTRVNVASFPYNYGTGAAAKVGWSNAIVPGIPSTNVLPDVGGPAATWSELGSSSSVPLVDINNTFQYAGALTWTRGTHNIKIGGGLIRRQINATQDTNGGGLFLFWGQPGPPEPLPDNRQNFITGNPAIEIRGVSLYPSAFRAWEPSAYVQDDWRVTPKLTLNLGVRYDVFTPITEAHGHYSNFLPSCLTSGTIGANCFVLGSQDPAIGVKTDHKDVAPRIGFAYSITPKTVLRGGFGISYFPPDVGEIGAGANAPASVVQNYNPPYSFNFFQVPFWIINGAISNTNSPATPGPVDLDTFAGNPNVTVVSAKPTNLRSSYVEMANLALQREIGANTFTAAWVGEFGRQLLRVVNLDENDTPGGPYVYATQMPFVNTITYAHNGAMSSYYAMQLLYNRRFTRGLTVNANYTWAHNLSNNGVYASSTGPTLVADPSVDYGNTENDVRHRIAVTGNYALPFGRSFTGAKGLLVKGWQLNAIVYWQTGFAFTVVNSSNRNVQGVSFDRPNQVANPFVAGAVSANPTCEGAPPGYTPPTRVRTTSAWFNPCALMPQTTGTLGDEGVGQLFGPHQRDADVSVNKDFGLTERWKMQFRAECFNLSNTPNFALPGHVLSQANVGQITSTGWNYSPREIQFALKLLF